MLGQCAVPTDKVKLASKSAARITRRFCVGSAEGTSTSRAGGDLNSLYHGQCATVTVGGLSEAGMCSCLSVTEKAHCRFSASSIKQSCGTMNSSSTCV